MKKFIAILSLCIVGMVGTYTGFWLYSARCFKQIIIVKSQDFLVHEGVDCKGFPFRLEAIIKNPTIREEIGKISTHGNWTIGTTLLGTRGWFEIDGKTTFEKLGSHLMCATSGMVRLELTQSVKSLNILKNFENLFPIHSKFEFWNDFSLYAKDLTIGYGSNDQPVFEVKHLTCIWNKCEVVPPFTIGRFLNLDLKGFEIHEKSLEPLLSRIFNPKYVLHGDNIGSGKSDLSLQARSLISSLDLNKEDTFAICLDIEKLTHANALYSGTMSGRLELNKNSTSYSGSIALDPVREYTEQFHPHAVSLWYAMVQQYQKTTYPAADYPKLDNLLTNHWNEVAKLIPDYSSLGPFEAHIKLDYAGDTNKASPSWNLDLKKCIIKTNSHEVGLCGYSGVPMTNRAPFLKIQFSNYEKSLQNLANYYSQWQALLISTQTLSAAEMPPVNDRVVARLTRFLESLSTQDQPNNLCIVIRGSNAADLMVGPFNTQKLDLACKQLGADIAAEIYGLHRPPKICVE